MLDNTEESPKRRSTFYVSLDGESRHGTKLTKTLSNVETEKFSCNTFPISTSKNVPNSVLSRTLSNNDAFVGHQQHQHKHQQRSASIDNSGGTTGEQATLPEQRGKVQSLTRIFEGPMRGCIDAEVDSSPNNQHEQQTRKKVERTRSFKTIERFQSRFTGRKEVTGRNNKESCGGRLNNTIACLDAGRDEEVPLIERRRKKDDNKDEAISKERRNDGKVHSKFGKSSRDSTARNSSTLSQQQNDTKRLSSKQNNIRNSDGTGGTSSTTTTFTNLLIRRTHSTKVVRSASTLVRSAASAAATNRHGLTSSTSCDSSSSSINKHTITINSINSVDCCNEKDYSCTHERTSCNDNCPGQNEDSCCIPGVIEFSTFEDPDGDAGVHSGTFSHQCSFGNIVLIIMSSNNCIKKRLIN